MCVVRSWATSVARPTSTTTPRSSRCAQREREQLIHQAYTCPWSCSSCVNGGQSVSGDENGAVEIMQGSHGMAELPAPAQTVSDSSSSVACRCVSHTYSRELCSFSKCRLVSIAAGLQRAAVADRHPNSRHHRAGRQQQRVPSAKTTAVVTTHSSSNQSTANNPAIYIQQQSAACYRCSSSAQHSSSCPPAAGVGFLRRRCCHARLSVYLLLAHVSKRLSVPAMLCCVLYLLSCAGRAAVCHHHHHHQRYRWMVL